MRAIYYCNSKTCDEGTPVAMSKLHFLWTKMYFNIEMYLRRGDTCHVGTLIQVSPRHRFYCMDWLFNYLRTPVQYNIMISELLASFFTGQWANFGSESYIPTDDVQVDWQWEWYDRAAGRAVWVSPVSYVRTSWYSLVHWALN